MHLCFIDEAGDLGALSNLPLPDEQPVLVIGGLFVDAANLPALTGHFLDLKHRYFPGLRYPSPRPLDRILPEVKGADIRRNATRGSARQQHHAIGFLDRILGLLRHNDVRLVARIWVKGIGSPGLGSYCARTMTIPTYASTGRLGRSWIQRWLRYCRHRR